MALKCVVTVRAEDGRHPKAYTKFEDATKYFRKQCGRESMTDAYLKSVIDQHGYASVIDDFGRSISIQFREVGYCKVCKKANVPLYNMNLEVDSKDCDIEVPRQRVAVCVDCADGYECGVWELEYRKGKVRIKQNEEDFNW